MYRTSPASARAMSSSSSMRHVRLPQELADLLRVLNKAVVVDLGGLTFSGPLKPHTSGGGGSSGNSGGTGAAQQQLLRISGNNVRRGRCVLAWWHGDVYKGWVLGARKFGILHVRTGLMFNARTYLVAP